jgi:O-Antigen ligase
MTTTESRPQIGPALPSTPTVASGQLRTLHAGNRAMRRFALVLPWVLAGYALFDKGFAYIRVPGTPIFAGELLVLLAAAAAFIGTGFMRRGLEHSTVAKILILLAAWGALRTIPNIGADGLNAIRDAALWYYSLLAIPVCAVLLWDENILRRWTRGYRKLIPWVLIWSPIALFIAKKAEAGLFPNVPGSTISFWTHEDGNIAVQVTIAVAFLWLVPGIGGRFRAGLTGLATIILILVATQNRGGFVAAGVALFVAWLFAKRRGRMTTVMVATLLFLLIAGWGLNIHYTGQQGRSISVDQLVQNLGSIAGGGKADATAPGNLDSNIQFRQQLWSAVITKVKEDKKVLIGLGFGVNVAELVGFQGQANPPLRSPHNSHVDIFARMGLIGAALWLLLWGFWGAGVLRARAKLKKLGRSFETGVLQVCIVGVVAILVNAYFDPTLESPQQAIWLWTLVGISLALVAISKRNAGASTAKA